MHSMQQEIIDMYVFDELIEKVRGEKCSALVAINGAIIVTT